MTYHSVSRRSNHQNTSSSADNSTLPDPGRSTKARSRVSKRDEAIRRKVEQELSRKKSLKSRSSKSQRTPGTVSSLRPQQALTVQENILVTEAAQLMAAKRMDSVLVVDSEEHLSGIFTSVDLACKVISEGIDPRNTRVSDIMTRRPLCVTSDTSAIEALNTMTTKGFRHLPVCNLEGDVVGLLDITKCLLEVLKKLDRAYGTSKKLVDAIEGMGKEWPINNSNVTVSMFQFMDLLKEKISCPTLANLIDGVQPPEVTPKTSVKEAARLMKKEKSTAVLVTEESQIVGIFTTKDIVLRVIAAGLDPSNCSVVRVMTPHPDCAPLNMTVVEALKKMNEGHFMNLPVVSEFGDVVGMLDILKLTYVTLEAVNNALFLRCATDKF
ncbi:CBS-domain-containing protein [Basidiobolus meristosporus CBS 931.73]|uniref:CBS-domain-containing protein n=1 Tax=Basidiobolus meristosporus CBS 931.73 TaxID=1314790 RepID=A0A1Y1YL66_9FUNG|nr:CBS-domain-containing protein [Basidiobolus meristosporus CBS 931.73]|eukprot:ORX98573.1 CBS-domain-containing protein [Basidiobolus meristosporus CBS 931.73]